MPTLGLMHNIKGKHRTKMTNKTKVYYVNKNDIYYRQGIDRFYIILFTDYCICEENNLSGSAFAILFWNVSHAFPVLTVEVAWEWTSWGPRGRLLRTTALEYNNFGDAVTFSPAPPWGWHLWFLSEMPWTLDGLTWNLIDIHILVKLSN